MYIAILGRLPALGMAELEQVYGSPQVRWFSDQSALIDSGSLSLDILGGVVKAGRVVREPQKGDWRAVSMQLVRRYSKEWSAYPGKLTLGISAYGFDITPSDVQKTGIILKKKLRESGVSLRLVPNTEAALNSAASHHNKLGLAENKKEILVVRARNGQVVIAESIGAQNITALARRDQARPKRDAFVGMLPPKLAQIMINLAGPPQQSRSLTPSKSNLQPETDQVPGPLSVPARSPANERSERKGERIQAPRVLDPFCGTGVILQEAALMGYDVYGTDLSDKMVEYSRTNLDWLKTSHHFPGTATVHKGDAMTTTWQQPIDAVVCETYLGQPFSAPPSPQKLREVRATCDHIIGTFLANIAPQLPPGTPLCVALPAWRDAAGNLTHLSVINKIANLGFTEVKFQHVKPSDLVYSRESQVVARELLVLIKT